MISTIVSQIDRLAKGGHLNNLLTFLSGASMIGAFAPINIWYAIFPGLLWFILPLQTLTLRQAIFRGLWFNIGFYTAGISWVHVSIYRFGDIPLFFSLPLTATFVFCLATYSTGMVYLLNRYFSQFSSKLYFLVAFPFSWMFVEWVAGWIFTGFPWLNIGHSQTDGLLSSIAPVLGSTGISFIIVFTVGLIALTLREGFKAAKITVPIIMALFIVISILHSIVWVETKDKFIDVSLIQPSIPQNKKWLPEERYKTLRYFKETTEPLVAELVIWPEGAIPALEQQVENYLQVVDLDAQLKSQAVLTGLAVREGEEFFNATIMLGTGRGRYYKQQLVPFGEYIPLQYLVDGLLGFMDIPMSSFSSGSDDQPLLRVGDWKIAMAICYEIIFQDVVANQLADADVLITLSNDAWFGDSFGAYQHLQIARMRALENGIPIIRGTNDGISAFIDHRGKIIKKMGKFEKGVLSTSVQAVSGLTPYRILGPHWIYLILLLIPGIILFLNRKPNK